MYGSIYNCQRGWECCQLVSTSQLAMDTYGHTYSKSMDQPGKVANPARGQLNRENEYFPVRVRV